MADTHSKSKLSSFVKRYFRAGTDSKVKSRRQFENVRQEEEAFTSIDRGISQVPLDKITGSVGRYHDFDAQFKPKSIGSNERLASITKEMKKGRSLPPISLYQIKDDFYILDGHHRFSAAKNLGHTHIKACILELLPSKETLENRLYIEKTEFRDRFDLTYTLELTELGQFDHIVQQIEEHQDWLEKNQKQVVSPSHAAADWYKTIYLPLKTLIENSGLVKSFKSRTVDDLYLYISIHQWHSGKKRRYGIGIDKLIPRNMEEFRQKMAEYSEQKYPEMRREITAFILINVEGRQEDKIIDKLMEIDEVREVHSVNGAIDIIIRVRLMRDLLSSDAELISQFMQTTIRQWNGIISTQTLLPGVSRLKDDNRR